MIANCKRRYISRLTSNIETEPVVIATRLPISFSRYFALNILGENYLISNIAQKDEIVFAYPMLRQNPVEIEKLHILFVNRKRCYERCICQHDCPRQVSISLKYMFIFLYIFLCTCSSYLILKQFLYTVPRDIPLFVVRKNSRSNECDREHLASLISRHIQFSSR